MFPQIGPDTYVRAAHFSHNDDAALFGALAAIDHTVEFMIVETPHNELLVRHAEIKADEIIDGAEAAGDKFPGTQFAEMARNLFGGDGAKARLVEEELANLRTIMESPGMGVFAIAGAKADVEAFIKAHLQQPDQA